MALMANRRKKKYGLADGNPLSLNHIGELVPDIKVSELEALVKKRILRKTKEGKFDLLNSKNSSGIDGVYRIFLPNSSIFSTLTATGTRDFVATEYVECDNPAEYKQCFIDQIYKKKKFRQVSSREAARIQGFPDTFKHHHSEYSAQKQFGNAVSPPVVVSLAKSLLKTSIFDTLIPNEGARKTRNNGKSQGVDALQLDFQSP